MRLKHLLSVFLTLLTLSVGQMWGAEGDTHDFTQTLEQNLNNGVSIDDITIDEQTYPIKKVSVTCRYNKTAGGFTVSVTVNGNAFGTPQTLNSNTTTTFNFEGESTKGEVVVSFTNNCTGSSKQGTCYCTNVQLTEGAAAGPSKTLSSIAITTQPTTKKYLVGDTFSKTGAVVTATYSDATTADVSGSASWTSTALTAGSNTITASYTEGGVNKTATTTVTAYSITVQKQDETGATITADGVSASASGRTLIASATDASKYVFKTWKYGTQAGTSISNATSATTGALTGTPSGAVTVIAEFYKPIPVTWNSNGSLHATTYTGYNQKPVFPDEPSSCSDESNTFYGWATSTWDNTVDNLAGKTVYTSADDMSNVTSAGTTYNAVFAKASAGSASWTKVTNSISAGDVIVIVNETASKELTSVGDINGTSCGITSAYSTTPAGTFPLTVETGNGGTGFSFKNGNNYLSWSSGNSLTTSTTKNNASSWTVNNPSSGNYTFSNVGDNTRKLQYNSGSPRFCCYTSSQQAFQIYRQNSSTTYSKYLTNCCTPLGSINGSFFWPTLFSYLTC